MCVRIETIRNTNVEYGIDTYRCVINSGGPRGVNKNAKINLIIKTFIRCVIYT